MTKNKKKSEVWLGLGLKKSLDDKAHKSLAVPDLGGTKLGEKLATFRCQDLVAFYFFWVEEGTAGFVEGQLYSVSGFGGFFFFCWWKEQLVLVEEQLFLVSRFCNFPDRTLEDRKTFD